MSRYLVERIKAQPNIEVLTGRDHGAGGPRRQSRTGALARPRAARKPRIRSATCSCSSAPTRTPTGSRTAMWRSIAKGFVRTGAEFGAEHHALETNRAGVFAIGDVRCGSVKRVAAAVGEGAQVVAALHAYLARTGAAAASHPAGACDGRRMHPCRGHPRCDAERARLRGMPEDRLAVGASAALPRPAAMSAAATTRPTATRPSISTPRTIPIIEGYDPPEGWGWCYVDEVFLDLGDRPRRKTARSQDFIETAPRSCAWRLAGTPSLRHRESRPR